MFSRTSDVKPTRFREVIMSSILSRLVALFLGPLAFAGRIAFSLALGVLALCGLFAFGTFLLGHQLSSLEAAGDCVVWAAALLILRAAVSYVVRRRSLVLTRIGTSRP